MSGQWDWFLTSSSTIASSTRRSTSSPADRVPFFLHRKLQVQKSRIADERDAGADAEKEAKGAVLPSAGEVAFGGSDVGAVIFIFIFMWDGIKFEYK